MNDPAVIDFLTHWTVARYRFHFEVTEPVALPPYAGSALRGVFGRALRRLACMTHEQDCKACPLYRSCVYTNLFETPAPQEHALQKFSQIPNPFVIEAPIGEKRFYEPGEDLSFNVVLIGKAVRQLALVTFALKKGLSFNVAHGKAELQSVEYLPEPCEAKKQLLFTKGDKAIAEHQINTAMPSYTGNANVTLSFQTHLRLQNNGAALGNNEITPRFFLNALVRRVALLSEFHMAHPLPIDFVKLSELAEHVQWEKDFHWHNWQRYSSRQKQRMHLGGLLGKCMFVNLPVEFMPFLYLGQWCHLGKNATFGLGKYLME